jgi:DNA-binding NtrC family response regulator
MMHTMQTTILHIGPADATLAQVAAGSGLAYINVATVDAALAKASSANVGLVFAGPEIELPPLFSQLKENKINMPVVAVGPAKPAQNAAKAIRLGAIEYLSTPVDGKMASSLMSKFKPTAAGSDPIAGDPKTHDLIEQAKHYATSDATVLLRGESGVGKEVFANLVHNHSRRNGANFIAVNCAAIPENLLESELFGHEKGAFSGALSKRLGKFQQANNGTLLLDEISEMDLSLQAKLLRAIQEKVIDPVGSEQPVPVNIRLIATTNRHLEDYVAEGKFREDLYFRLNVVALEIPPLRERKGDILPLAEFFVQKYAFQDGVDALPLSAAAQQKLQDCYWKGNVRELENTLHRAVLLSAGQAEISPEHIIISPMSLRAMENQADAVQTNAAIKAANVNAAAAQRYAAASDNFSHGTGGFNAPPMVGKSLHEAERDLIMSTLSYCQGNRSHAAEILGISIRTLREKLNTYETGQPA